MRVSHQWKNWRSLLAGSAKSMRTHDTWLLRARTHHIHKHTLQHTHIHNTHIPHYNTHAAHAHHIHKRTQTQKHKHTHQHTHILAHTRTYKHAQAHTHTDGHLITTICSLVKMVCYKRIAAHDDVKLIFFLSFPLFFALDATKLWRRRSS